MKKHVSEDIKKIIDEYYTALRLIYFADENVESFDDYEDLIRPLIRNERVKRLIRGEEDNF